MDRFSKLQDRYEKSLVPSDPPKASLPHHLLYGFLAYLGINDTYAKDIKYSYDPGTRDPECSFIIDFSRDWKLNLKMKISAKNLGSDSWRVSFACVTNSYFNIVDTLSFEPSKPPTFDRYAEFYERVYSATEAAIDKLASSANDLRKDT